MARYLAKLMWWWCVCTSGDGDDSSPGVSACLKEVAAEGVALLSGEDTSSSRLLLLLPPYGYDLWRSGVRAAAKGSTRFGEKKSPSSCSGEGILKDEEGD